jgi:hypothetical protein
VPSFQAGVHGRAPALQLAGAASATAAASARRVRVMTRLRHPAVLSP